MATAVAMRRLRRRIKPAWLTLLLPPVLVGAIGARCREEAQITHGAALGAREDNVCGSSMKLCPSSLSGGCCPDSYDCAEKSCYATENHTVTCGGRVGWYGCAAVYGGGCCPQGYQCERAGACVPPSDSPYTFGCPASQHLCPSSMNYGCCPDGLACAVNSCYATESSTITTKMHITTTQHGSQTVIESVATRVVAPEQPTAVQTIVGEDADDQAVFKYFPTAVAKVSPTSTSSSDGNEKDNGLSTGALVGIVVGAVGLLVIVLIAAFIIIRHLNRVSAIILNSSKPSGSSKPRPGVKKYKPTASEVDYLSVDPLMMSPEPSHARHDPTSDFAYGGPSPDSTSAEPTPSSFAGVHQPVGNDFSRHPSLDAEGNIISYFGPMSTGQMQRSSVQSGMKMPHSRGIADSHGTYTHLRHWSQCSDPPSDNEGGPILGIQPGQANLTELEGSPYVPELQGSTLGREMMDHSRPFSSQRPSRELHQRKRSDGPGQSSPLGIVDEELPFIDGLPKEAGNGT